MSPKPPSCPPSGAGLLMYGTIARAISFQSLFSVIGMTGWMFRL